MVRIVDPAGRFFDIQDQPVVLNASGCVRLMQRQGDALVRATEHENVVVIIPLLEAALIPIGWMMMDIARRHPETCGKFEIATMKWRGGGSAHERRDALSQLNHSVANKAVVIFDPCVDSGKTFTKVRFHAELHGYTNLYFCALVLKTATMRASTPKSIGKPHEYTGTDYLVGGFGLDLEKKFREYPDLVTVPPGSKPVVVPLH